MAVWYWECVRSQEEASHFTQQQSQSNPGGLRPSFPLLCLVFPVRPVTWHAQQPVTASQHSIA